MVHSTKKQKKSERGNIVKKALDEIHGQTLQILRSFNIGNIRFF